MLRAFLTLWYFLYRVVLLPYYLFITPFILIVMWGEWVQFKMSQIRVLIELQINKQLSKGNGKQKEK